MGVGVGRGGAYAVLQSTLLTYEESNETETPIFVNVFNVSTSNL